MTIGERIKFLRQKQGLTQVQLSDRVGIGKQLLYKYETNIITNIPSDRILAIAIALNTTPSYLMGWDEKKTDAPPDEKSKKLLQIMQQLPDDALDELLNYAVYLASRQQNQ